MDAAAREPAAAAMSRPTRLRLWGEMLALFVGVPVLMAYFFGSYPLFPVLIALTVVAAGLLAITPGFGFRELLRWPAPGSALIAVLMGIATFVICSALALWLVPDRYLAFPRDNTRLWLMVMLLYPLASALPQELIYRPLFFRRYGGLFRSERWALAANAAAFGLGHLFYMNPVTILSTVVAGAIFGAAYLRSNCFLFAVLLHALAGQIMFTSGLGVFFYHGAVGRTP
ncbi:hypothetical protein LNKW23_05170 [Paralimibaculum aggregatum]|uniref:CAAX prenyl protease 2/Lysostaphin resistance protein A-like domain-containing protein n=1 Tax=Paralimibaculum aggregatum TaxID=3036245 RepID=A0ABQ6LD67_9RHOB|nr:CPBP family intramembrane glutamic endopeptidase [Limibaculum sp. NKW23]GMG81304.1 hypothetical protein LNKW23_05170 [Limibaculum sp. NKW23]